MFEFDNEVINDFDVLDITKPSETLEEFKRAEKEIQDIAKERIKRSPLTTEEMKRELEIQLRKLGTKKDDIERFMHFASDQELRQAHEEAKIYTPEQLRRGPRLREIDDFGPDYAEEWDEEYSVDKDEQSVEKPMVTKSGDPLYPEEPIPPLEPVKPRVEVKKPPPPPPPPPPPVKFKRVEGLLPDDFNPIYGSRPTYVDTWFYKPGTRSRMDVPNMEVVARDMMADAGIPPQEVAANMRPLAIIPKTRKVEYAHAAHRVLSEAFLPFVHENKIQFSEENIRKLGDAELYFDRSFPRRISQPGLMLGKGAGVVHSKNRVKAKKMIEDLNKIPMSKFPSKKSYIGEKLHFLVRQGFVPIDETIQWLKMKKYDHMKHKLPKYKIFFKKIIAE